MHAYDPMTYTPDNLITEIITRLDDTGRRDVEGDSFAYVDDSQDSNGGTRAEALFEVTDANGDTRMFSVTVRAL